MLIEPIPAEGDSLLEFYRLRSEALPLQAMASNHVHRIVSRPGRSDPWKVAAREGREIHGVAWASAPGEFVMAGVAVRPSSRGRGVGRALAESLRAHLLEVGVDLVRAINVDREDGRSLRFALEAGAVDKSTGPAGSFVLEGDALSQAGQAEPDPDVTVIDRTHLHDAAWLHGLHEVFAIADEDFPDEPPMPLEEFVSGEEERLAHGGFAVAIREGGQVVGAAFASRLFGVPALYSDYTLLRPEWRGRGLGLRLKREQARLAAGLGLRVVTDTPDDPAMHRILTRLGYRHWDRTGVSWDLSASH